MARMTPENSGARAMKRAISPVDLDVDHFAYIYVDKSVVIQTRTFEIVIALILQWAEQFDAGISEEYTAHAKRLREVIEEYGMG